MFRYCVDVLHFAEGVALRRIQVARAARRHPELLEAVRRGDLHVTAASLLAPQLARENVQELIRAATHKTADQVRALLADRSPRPDVSTLVRRIPTAVPPARPIEAQLPNPAPEAPSHAPQAERPPTPLAPPPPPRPEPLGGERYCVRFTADPETWAQLEELRALMRHQVPDGDVGRILGKAISALLTQVRKQKLGECSRPRSPERPIPDGNGSRTATSSPSRAIPAGIRREVFRRDGGRCTYVSAAGHPCGAREFIEFHHRDPWARARAHSADAITLRCHAHNQHQAERDFGARHMARFRNRAEARPREHDPDHARQPNGLER